MDSLILYVATDGDDGWSGKLAAPSLGKTDGPFATLARARDATREIIAEGGLDSPVTVLVRGGKYYLDKTLVLGAQDSGSRDHPINYSAYAGETPVLSGGARLDGWQPHKGRILKCRFSEAKRDLWKYRQLFFRGRRQVRARRPNFQPENPLYGGWAFMEGPAEEGSSTTFRFRPGTFDRRWDKPAEGEVYVCAGKYGSYALPIRSIDWENRIITVTHSGRNFDRYPWFRPIPFFPDDRFVVENVLEELDQPGEWCLDGEEGTLYFWPPDESFKEGEVVVPVLDCLINLRDARWINISGFTFTETTTGDNMHRDGQEGYGAMFPMPGREYCGEALHMRGTEHCRIENNHFREVGGNAIYFEDYNSRNLIRNNEISYAGKNGICMLGSKYFHPVPHHPIFNQVEDNYIHHCGVFDNYCAGIFLGLSQGNVLAHNLIEYVPHHAINLGGSGFGRNIVEFNKILHTSLEIQDSAAINMWMEDPDSHSEKEAERSGHIIRHNLIADVRGCAVDETLDLVPSPSGVGGIYLDGFASNCFVYGNIIARSGYGFLVNLGKNNIIENNVIVDSECAVRYMAFHSYAPHMYGFTTGNRFCRNIVRRSSAGGPLYRLVDSRGELPAERMIEQSDHNLFFSHDGGEYTVEENLGDFGKRREIVRPEQAGDEQQDYPEFDAGPRAFALAEWQKRGFDTHSITADPLFEDPEQDNYRLAPDSPAFKVGFLPIDIDQIGRRDAGPKQQ